MTQTVGRRPLTVKARFNSGLVHVGLIVDTVQLGKVFQRLLRFSPASVITLMPHTQFTDHATLYQEKGSRLANI